MTCEPLNKPVAIVPARAGSKRLPGKNYHPLLGKPLIQYTLEAAKESDLFTQILVSTDDPVVADIALKLDCQPLERPSALGQDDSTTDAVIADVITRVNLSDKQLIVLLQPTSPLRQAHHIVQAYHYYQSLPSSDNGVISLVKGSKKYLKAYCLLDQELTPIYRKDASYSCEQALPDVYLPNGALYLFSVAAYRAEGCIPRSGLKPYIMAEHDSIDIDTIEDLREAERLIKARM